MSPSCERTTPTHCRCPTKAPSKSGSSPSRCTTSCAPYEAPPVSRVPSRDAYGRPSRVVHEEEANGNVLVKAVLRNGATVPWLRVAESKLLAGMGYSGAGLYADRFIARGQAFATYVGRTIGPQGDDAEWEAFERMSFSNEEFQQCCNSAMDIMAIESPEILYTRGDLWDYGESYHIDMDAKLRRSVAEQVQTKAKMIQKAKGLLKFLKAHNTRATTGSWPEWWVGRPSVQPTRVQPSRTARTSSQARLRFYHLTEVDFAMIRKIGIDYDAL
eukprot:jgi/Mesvir1/12416/Mv00584-RA.1